MYLGSSGKIISISKDFLHISIKLNYTYKNKNFVGSIFWGSMFAAVDLIPMIQRMLLFGDDYVVWDKSAEIYFKRAAREALYADFDFQAYELGDLQNKVMEQKEIDSVETTELTNEQKNIVYCEVHKTIYRAEKPFYKQKRKLRKATI
ncbi:MAG: hypothetical protein ACJAU2_001091 [Maribacter sp.]|jgi:hypothetical protein